MPGRAQRERNRRRYPGLVRLRAWPYVLLALGFSLVRRHGLLGFSDRIGRTSKTHTGPIALLFIQRKSPSASRPRYSVPNRARRTGRRAPACARSPRAWFCKRCGVPRRRRGRSSRCGCACATWASWVGFLVLDIGALRLKNGMMPQTVCYGNNRVKKVACGNHRPALKGDN